MHPSGDQRLGAFESSTWCPDHLHSALLVPKLVNMTKSLAWSNNSREGRFVLFYTWRGNDGPSWLGGCRGVRRLMTLYLCLRSSEHTRRWGYKLRLRAQQHTSPKETASWSLHSFPKPSTCRHTVHTFKLQSWSSLLACCTPVVWIFVTSATQDTVSNFTSLSCTAGNCG